LNVHQIYLCYFLNKLFIQSVDTDGNNAYTKSSFWNYSQISKAALFFKPKQKFSKNKQNTNTFIAPIQA